MLLILASTANALPFISINSPYGVIPDRNPLLNVSAPRADTIWYSLDGSPNITLASGKDTVSHNISMIPNSGFETTKESTNKSVPMHWHFYDSQTPMDWNTNSYTLTGNTPFGKNALKFTYDANDSNDGFLHSMFIETEKKIFDIELYVKPNMTFNSGNAGHGYCIELITTKGNFSTIKDEFILCLNNTQVWSLDELATSGITTYSRTDIGDSWLKINFTTPQISENATFITIALFPAIDDTTYTGDITLDEISILLDHGPHTLDIWANDTQGTSHREATFTISDYKPPKITIISPENNTNILKGTIIELNITTEHALDTVEYTTGTHTQALSEPYEIDTEDWHTGPVTITVKANDTNNLSTTETFYFPKIFTTINIENISPSIRLFINGTEYLKGGSALVPMGERIEIKTRLDNTNYTDIIHITKSFNLTVHKTNQSTHLRLNNYSIYVFDSQDTSIDLSGKNIAVIGLHSAGNLEIRNAGIFKAYGLIESENLTITGTDWDYFYLNNINAKNLVLDGTSNGILIEDAAIKNNFKIVSCDIESVTILRLVSDGCALFDKPGNSLDWKGSFNTDFELNDDMMFFKSKNPGAYDFSPGWFVNGICKNYFAGNNNTSPNSGPSVFMNLGTNNYGAIFNAHLKGSIYLDNSGGAWYSLNLLGPLIEFEEFLIDDISSSPDSTELIFYGEDISGTLPILDSIYEKDINNYDYYYSKTVSMDSQNGRFAFGNAKDNNINFRTASSPQDIIFLSGSNRISFEAQQDNTWNLYLSEGSHWIVEDKPIEILWDYPEFRLYDNFGNEKGTWNPKAREINITLFNIERNNDDITISLNTTDNESNVYLLHRRHGDLAYTRAGTTRLSGLWQKTFPALPEGYHEIIGIATQSAGIYGKAHKQLIAADYTPPMVSLLNPKGTLYTNSTIISAAVNANDNLAEVLACRANISGTLNPAYVYDVLNNTDTTISVAATSEGSHTLSIVCYDDANNSKRTQESIIIVDMTKPVLAIASPSGQDTATGTINITADASDSLSGIESVTAKIKDEDGALHEKTLVYSSGSYRTEYDTSSLKDRTQAITLTAKDRAGNQETGEITIFVDNTGPWVNISVDRETAKISEKIEITVSIDKSDALSSTFIFNIKKGESIVLEENLTDKYDNGVYHYTWDTKGREEGTYTIYASVKDPLDNNGTCSKNINLIRKPEYTGSSGQSSSTTSTTSGNISETSDEQTTIHTSNKTPENNKNNTLSNTTTPDKKTEIMTLSNTTDDETMGDTPTGWFTALSSTFSGIIYPIMAILAAMSAYLKRTDLNKMLTRNNYNKRNERATLSALHIRKLKEITQRR